MKRIQEKVKDIVEVRQYTNLQDYLADPAQTLAAYHFTDATAELMAKWLNKAADVQTRNGAAIALAGYRGVGKSHFLAAFGAIAANPELRSKITDQHVSASAQQLKRRHHPVVYVRRGTHATLADELKAALEIEAANLGNSLTELLNAAAGKAADLPFLIIIDTAGERASRVARDDGSLLGEIARIAKSLNIFVAVALDDDISGADGVNAAIAQNYAIDFLDQEHLYRIVDTHIFPKNRQMQPILHDIYSNFREALPHFRWSEQRFSSLYPLHPVILENASFVRLYVPDFALLGFASEAGAKILGRPANSLIGLDEVFDKVEAALRKVDALTDAFQTYDRLNAEVVGQISVMRRLQAKLILKALMLLSLDGGGASAGEIGAAMLIYDENEPKQAVKTVEDLLESFVSALPEAVSRIAEEGREIRYNLKISGKDNLNTALGEAAETISPSVIPKILRRLAREKFLDWTLAERDESESSNEPWTDSQAIWRGGVRRGRLLWNLENSPLESQTENSDYLDWEVIINASQNSNENAGEIPTVYWKPAPIRKDEAETILRYYVLLSEPDFEEEYDEQQIHAAKLAHTIAVEKIWNRMFIEEAKFVIEGFDYNFTEEARAAENLSELFSIMLEPLFETRYPNHPFFAQTLGMAEVSSLVNDFFSGARANFSEVQHLAEAFALPLELVRLHGATYLLEREENILNLPFSQEVLALVKESGEETVSLKTVYQRLKQSPFGLTREAQHLILTALVAQRQVEFVTSKGDRINRRSLDLKLIWDDIEGVAKPETVIYGNQKLSDWARILTGADNLPSIETPENCEEVKKALKIWLEDWRKARILERFAELPDEILNTKIWRLAANAEKSFGAVASTVEEFSDEAVSLEETLHRIADAFSDSEREFFARTKDLVLLEDFINGIVKREKIWSYLAVCETTRDEKTEYFREKLLHLISESYFDPNEATNRETENMWQTFHARFVEHFAVKHDLVMKSHHLQEKSDEILRSDEWWEFESLSRLSVFPRHHLKQAQETVRRLKALNCRFEAREMLKTHPFCACSFNLEKIREWERLPQNLFETINRGRESYRKILRLLSETLVSLIEQVAKKERDEEFSAAASHLIEVLQSENEIPLLTNTEIVILQKIFESLPSSPLLNLNLPAENNYLERDEIKAKINVWLDEMPSEPVLIKM